MRELRRIVLGVDKILLFMVSVACIFGLLAIASATKLYETPRFVLVQGFSFLLGLLFMFVVMIADYEAYASKAKFLYIVSVLLLILVKIIGTGADEVGSQSWIRFGPVGFQPSEIIKLFFIITFAKHLSIVEDSVNQLLPLLGLLAHAGLLIGLILLQPDYGTAMVYIFIFAGMLFTANISYKYLLAAGGLFAAAAPLIWFFLLEPFQRSRILDFLEPEKNIQGSGYQVVQSKIAIGAGGLTGKGLFQGTQTQMGILPESHTDFIFSVVGEEFGFLGCVITVGALFFIIYRCLAIGRVARSNLGAYICVGVASMLLFQVYENIGMCIGVMPVTGIPLPFFSYGGSAMVTNLISIGLVMNVWMRRKSINF